MAEHLDILIGGNLRQIRLQSGFDIDGLAGRMGLPSAAIALYEAGRIRIPVEVLTALAETLGRPVHAFFA